MSYTGFILINFFVLNDRYGKKTTFFLVKLYIMLYKYIILKQNITFKNTVVPQHTRVLNIFIN